MTYILAIDQGTTSTRAILFDDAMQSCGHGAAGVHPALPAGGLGRGMTRRRSGPPPLAVCRKVMADLGASAADIAGIGITNQRETTVVWDKATGKAIHNAIVWQDRRTAAICGELRAAGHEEMVTDRTGLLLDPYFSGTKVKWILDTVDGARQKAEAGELLFGTVDSFLIWRLTGACLARNRCNQCRPDADV